MAELKIEIDQKTGEMSIDFIGIVGPDCDRMTALIEEYTGKADTVKLKPEDYYVKPKGQTRVRKG